MNNENMEHVLILGAVKDANVNIYQTGNSVPVWTGITDSTGKVIKSSTDTSLPLLSYGNYDLLIDKCDYDSITKSFNVPDQTILALTVGCSSAISTHEVTYNHSLISTPFIISPSNFKKIASLNVRNSADSEFYREANEENRLMKVFITEEHFFGSMNIYFEARSGTEGEKIASILSINDSGDIWFKSTYSSLYTSYTIRFENLDLPKGSKIYFKTMSIYARRYMRNCRLMYDDVPIKSAISADILPTDYVIVSDRLQYFDDSEIRFMGSIPVKTKSIIIKNKMSGKARFKFDMSSFGLHNDAARTGIYKNGTLIGTVQQSIVNTYTTFTEDITQNWLVGDTIELWSWNANTSSGYGGYVKMFNVYYDWS